MAPYVLSALVSPPDPTTNPHGPARRLPSSRPRSALPARPTPSPARPSPPTAADDLEEAVSVRREASHEEGLGNALRFSSESLPPPPRPPN